VDRVDRTDRMNLTETEESILDKLYGAYRERGDGAFLLSPARGGEAAFEKGLKRLDFGGFIEIEDRYDDNKAVLRLTARGKELGEKRAGEADVETRTVELEAIEAWDEPPTGREFVRYEELEPGDRFEDREGHEWVVPRQVDHPAEEQRILNRTAIDFRRGIRAYVPEHTYVRSVDDAVFNP